MEENFVRINGITFKGITGLLDYTKQEILEKCVPKKSGENGVANIAIVMESSTEGNFVTSLVDKVNSLYQGTDVLPVDYIVQVVRGFAMTNNLIIYVVTEDGYIFGFNEDEVKIQIYGRSEINGFYKNYAQVAMQNGGLNVPVFSFRSRKVDDVLYLGDFHILQGIDAFNASLELYYISMLSAFLNKGFKRLVLEDSISFKYWEKLHKYLFTEDSEAYGKVQILSIGQFADKLNNFETVISIGKITHPDTNVIHNIKQKATEILGTNKEVIIKNLKAKSSDSCEVSVQQVVDILKTITEKSVFTTNSKHKLMQFATIMYVHKLSNPELPKPHLILPNCVANITKEEYSMLSKLFVIH